MRAALICPPSIRVSEFLFFLFSPGCKQKSFKDVSQGLKWIYREGASLQAFAFLGFRCQTASCSAERVLRFWWSCPRSSMDTTRSGNQINILTTSPNTHFSLELSNPINSSSVVESMAWLNWVQFLNWRPGSTKRRDNMFKSVKPMDVSLILSSSPCASILAKKSSIWPSTVVVNMMWSCSMRKEELT